MDYIIMMLYVLAGGLTITSVTLAVKYNKLNKAYKVLQKKKEYLNKLYDSKQKALLSLEEKCEELDRQKSNLNMQLANFEFNPSLFTKKDEGKSISDKEIERILTTNSTEQTPKVTKRSGKKPRN